MCPVFQAMVLLYLKDVLKGNARRTCFSAAHRSIVRSGDRDRFYKNKSKLMKIGNTINPSQEIGDEVETTINKVNWHEVP